MKYALLQNEICSFFFNVVMFCSVLVFSSSLKKSQAELQGNKEPLNVL